ncbi:MAG: glycoside hydrolase family 3 C-terminal domain-containing protein [Oscillospiraceae bacterium]|nr:glycoside hydrolase family 3 C-terminal domain-containing protein [Oscillospiraceae bacterium]MBR4691679.1 glycoside hydrolase family 3 C-terminal domain-containing protein [Oscillospiraceae bacterium]
MDAYRDPARSFAERAADLVSRMTTEEKIEQIRSAAPALERLGIPEMDWWSEALHGVAREGTATMFPQSIGLGATFDPQLVGEIGKAVGQEARIKYEQYSSRGVRDLFKGLSLYSPNINIFRDPRWGRGQETYGEDPWLTGRMGVRYIRGLQGDDPAYLMTAACAKHYAVHSGPEPIRHEFDAEVSPKDLRETYLPAFEAAVREAGVAQVMGAYNRTLGEPCCASELLLQQVLREEWGFEGMVVSDFTALKDFYTGHKVTKDAPESAALALKHGCDMNLGFVYLSLPEALERGLVDEADIDKACRKVMEIRLRLGLYETPDSLRVDHALLDSPEHRALNLKAARESLVLLKNDGLLPLRGKFRSVAVLGPNAMSTRALMGNYHGEASEYVTVLDGIRRAAGAGVRIRYGVGCELTPYVQPASQDKKSGDDISVSFFDNVAPTFNLRELMGHGDREAEALAMAEESEAVVLVLGLDETVEGEEMMGGYSCDEFAGGDKKTLLLPSNQRKLLEDVLALGKPTAVVLLSGSALSVDDPRISALVQAWYPGSLGGQAVGELLFGDFSPSGRLPVTFYRRIEDLPPFTDYAMKNRTYRYFEGEPLYPFGYGLSYTSFAYADLSVTVGEEITVSVTVSNTGDREGREVVQAYVRWDGGDETQPLRHLCALGEAFLRPGEAAEVTLRIPKEALYTYRADGSRAVEPGSYTLWVGGGQPDERSAALTGVRPLSAGFVL